MSSATPSRTDIRQPDDAYVYTFSPFHPPIARVQPGEPVRIHCLDCFANRLDDESKRYADVCEFPYLNPQTGPIFVLGAECGDTLLVHIEDIEITRDWAVSGLVPSFGLLTGTARTRMLNPALPGIVKKMPIRAGRVWFDGWSRPISPFMGTFGTAPRIEAINSLTPDAHGGNMDCPEICPGNTVHLPVQVEGALFFTGDGHALQGCGEIGGIASEVSANLCCTFELIKGHAIAWPRVSNAEYLMTIGSARPLDDAVRIACCELALWVGQLTRRDPVELLPWLTQIIELRIGNVCDPNYSAVAAVRKEYLGLDVGAC